MEFPDFPFIRENSFISGPEVLQYLEDYSNQYDLKKHIKVIMVNLERIHIVNFLITPI